MPLKSHPDTSASFSKPFATSPRFPGPLLSCHSLDSSQVQPDHQRPTFCLTRPTVTRPWAVTDADLRRGGLVSRWPPSLSLLSPGQMLPETSLLLSLAGG